MPLWTIANNDEILDAGSTCYPVAPKAVAQGKRAGLPEPFLRKIFRENAVQRMQAIGRSA